MQLLRGRALPFVVCVMVVNSRCFVFCGFDVDGGTTCDGFDSITVQLSIVGGAHFNTLTEVSHELVSEPGLQPFEPLIFVLIKLMVHAFV